MDINEKGNFTVTLFFFAFWRIRTYISRAIKIE